MIKAGSRIGLSSVELGKSLGARVIANGAGAGTRDLVAAGQQFHWKYAD
jgi:hypothetical protein